MDFGNQIVLTVARTILSTKCQFQNLIYIPIIYNRYVFMYKILML